jgi:hypothetical protein
MKKTTLLLLLLTQLMLLAGCSALLPVLLPMGQAFTQATPLYLDSQYGEPFIGPPTLEESRAQAQVIDDPEVIDKLPPHRTLFESTAFCEIPDSDDDCVGTYYYIGNWIPEPKSSVTAYHEGDGEFVVTLFREDNSSEVIFSAAGVYTSETITLTSRGMVSMTVQSTGPWHIDFKRIR